MPIWGRVALFQAVIYGGDINSLLLLLSSCDSKCYVEPRVIGRHCDTLALEVEKATLEPPTRVCPTEWFPSHAFLSDSHNPPALQV